MHRKLILLLLTVLLPTSMVLANPVDAEQARQTAMSFLHQQVARGARRMAPAANDLQLVKRGAKDSYFLFTTKAQGFVVVSGDDCAEPILGYSHTGSLQPDSMPCGMAVLLDGYEQQIAYIREHGLENEIKAQAPRKDRATEFHLSDRLTTFDQGDPYNLECPTLPNGNHCATGCVATAMAGLMYFHRWPQATLNTIPGYRTDTLQLRVREIPAGTPINWDRIKAHYTENATAEEGRNEIATLMNMAGAAVRMDYNESSSAYGPSVPYALRRYFNYDMAVYEESSNYTAAAWEEKLRKEIAMNGPVIYGGARENGKDKNGKTIYAGHAFLLEGYDANGYFDVNFGWGGEGNNRFRLTVVDAPFRYVYYQGALFGVLSSNPLENVPASVRLWTEKLEPSNYDVYKRSAVTGDFENIVLDYTLLNYMPVSHPSATHSEHIFDAGVTFRKKGNIRYESCKQIWGNLTVPLTAWVENDVDDTFSYGSGLTDGLYDVLVVSRTTGTEEWSLNDNSQHAFAQAAVCGDMLAFKSPKSHAAQLSVTDVVQTGSSDLIDGQEATFTYKVSNLVAPALYDGAILVKLVWDDGYGQPCEKVVSIGEMHVQGTATRQFTFSLTPPASGDMELHFLDRCWNEIHSHALHVKKAGTNPDDPDEPVTPVNPDAPSFASYSAKYWFDDQPQLAGTLSDVRAAFQLDVSALADGLHALHIAVCGTSTEGDYYEDTPRTVYFEKHGQETQIRNRFFIDDVETSIARYDVGNSVTLALPVEKVSEGLHKLTAMIETTAGIRPVVVNSYFQRVATASEQDEMRLCVSIDGATPTTLQNGFKDGSLEYNLDVSQMQPGLHTLTYQVKGRLQTPPEKTFFVIDPKINGYDYWINGDRTTQVHTAMTPTVMPYELNVNVPVRSMPLRSDNFHFNIEEGIPVAYAVNDFTFQAATNNGYWDYCTAQYIDTNSRQAIGAVLLPQNESVTAPAPAAGKLKWFYLKANRGDIIGLKASRPCTLQLFSPNADEIYKASGNAVMSIKETEAPKKGTYYLALHDPTDSQGEADITVTYVYTDNGLSDIRGDVNGDGVVNVSDVTAIINHILGKTPSVFSMDAADVNGDGKVNVSDVTATINIILGK